LLSGNRVVYLELHTGNLPRACAFYTRLFGWRAERFGLDAASYLMLERATEWRAALSSATRTNPCNQGHYASLLCDPYRTRFF
jgi:predicted enzyme related to lactoylglutathione lyase